MVPQAECSSDGGQHPAIDEQVVKHDERRENVDIADLVPNSNEAGTWYYVVDCATCKAAIPFKHAPEGEPILRLPTMRVRCFQCSTVHTYASDLISHRKAAAPCGIFRRDQPAETPDNAQEASPDRQEDRSDGDTGGREIVECKIEPDTSSLQRGSGVIAAVSGKRATIFFLSSCFFAAGWVLQLALNISSPATFAAYNDLRPYAPEVLLDTAYFGTILCGLALFIFGTGSLLVERYGRERDFLRKDVSVLPARNAFIISWEKMANATSFAQQASRVLSIISLGAATFRAQIRRSAKLRLRHYR
jgi:hypothetical protein